MSKTSKKLKKSPLNGGIEGCEAPLRNERFRPIIYTWFNPPPDDLPKYRGVSETVPDQAMSIQEILARSLQGYPLPVGRTPKYTGTDDFDDYDSNDHDLTDLDDFINRPDTKGVAPQAQPPLPQEPSGNASEEAPPEA